MILVEAKKLSSQSKVSVETVRKLLSAIPVVGATMGILVTTSGYTAAATALAEASSLILHSLKDLLDTKSIEELLNKIDTAKVQAVARRFLDWLDRYNHHSDTPTESFKTFIVASKCIVEYGVTYDEYVSVAEVVKESDVEIDWIIPTDTFEFLVAESKRAIKGRK